MCVEIIELKLIQIRDTIKKAQESANSDTKSSMGDKYETGRAMAQLEIEKSIIQKAEIESQLRFLARIATFAQTEIIGNGCLVICNTDNYYISVSLGILSIGNEKYFAVSSQSPIGQKMLGLTKGSKFSVNGREMLILDVF